MGEPNVVDFEELLLPRRSVAELFEIGARLVRENADLPAPCLLCDVSPGVGELSFQLEPEPASVPVLVAWADRFAGVLRAGTCAHVGQQPCRWVRVTFPFDGVPVLMYVRLPAVQEALPFDRQV